MYRLFIHDDARADFDQLWEQEPHTAATIAAVLKECADSQDLLDRLTQHGYGEDGTTDFRVTKYLEHWNRGDNLWSLKIWGLERAGVQYRIIYAFMPGKLHYYVLAIVHRDFAYDRHHPITERILRAYREL